MTASIIELVGIWVVSLFSTQVLFLPTEQYWEGKNLLSSVHTQDKGKENPFA